MFNRVVPFLLFLCLLAALIKISEFSREGEEGDLAYGPVLPVTDTNVRQKREDCSCACGLEGLGNLVLVGSKISPNQYPWMVSIWLGRELRCSGVILTEIHILTTGTCVYGIRNKDFTVIAGSTNVHTLTGNEQYAVIESGFYNKNYNPLLLYNDIAVAVLTTSLQWSPAVRPACLPFSSNMEYDRMQVTDVGWGSRIKHGKETSVMHKIDLQVIKQKFCQKHSGNRWKVVDDSMICILRDKHGPCQEDKSGVLHLRYDTGVIEVIGILPGNLTGCPKYTAYISFSYYLDWIDGLLGDTCRCIDRT